MTEPDDLDAQREHQPDPSGANAAASPEPLGQLADDEPARMDERTELERFVATRMLRRHGEGRHERIGKVTLRLLTGPHAGLVASFTGDRVEGGRGSANDLVLDDSAVSHSHFELVLGRESVHLRDLGSTNGTWLGPVRVDKAWIPDKTIFTVGQTDIEVAATRRMKVPASLADQFGPVRGKSNVMRELFVLLERLAATDLDVLFQGEPGTGKRIAAEALHRRSSRKKNALVFYDCGEERDVARIDDALFKTEAQAARLLEEARGGTLVLRRIEDLPIHLQAKLLGAMLERDELRESTAVPSDVRLVLLSTLDLRMLASEGLFHEGLYARIAQASLRMPPLRERSGDAVFLMEHFLVDISVNSRLLPLSPDAIRALSLYTFPGNVRELRDVAVRAVSNASGDEITRRDLLLGSSDDLAGFSGLSRMPFREAKDRFIQLYFTMLGQDCEGSVDDALRRSGVSLSTMRRMLPQLFR